MKLPIPFDNPATYSGHSGVDYGQPNGTPIPASGSGYVMSRGYNNRGGYYIWVKYDAIEPLVGYHHMPSHDQALVTGTRFSYGDRLGVVGSTGNSTGPHLHSEVQGHTTTDGYWKFFDAGRVVGDPAVDNITEEDMKLLYVTDSVDGNDVPGWALLNTRTGELVTLREDGASSQDNANSWARVWGNARKVSRQDMLNAVAAIKVTA